MSISTYDGFLAILTWIAVLADADPLGVNVNVTFDEVGGLDDRESPPLSFLFRSNFGD